MDKHFGCWLVEVGWRDFPGTFLLWEDGKSWAELEILRNGPNSYREFKPSSSTFLGKVCRGCLKMLVFWALCTSHEESEFMSTTVSVAWAELWCKWWRNRRNSRHRYFLNISVRLWPRAKQQRLRTLIGWIFVAFEEAMYIYIYMIVYIYYIHSNTEYIYI